jgi:hypothetical protein
MHKPATKNACLKLSAHDFSTITSGTVTQDARFFSFLFFGQKISLDLLVFLAAEQAFIGVKVQVEVHLPDHSRLVN